MKQSGHGLIRSILDIVSFNLAYGPCWEPTMAQVNLAMNKVSRPSVDPSPPLPFWDKFRLLLHGRLTISVQQTRWLYHASLDPYNVTEFMDWTWTEFLLDWTNGIGFKFFIRLPFNFFLRLLVISSYGHLFISSSNDCLYFFI